MTTGINSQTALLAVGILQPATAKEIRAYLAKIFSSVAVIPVMAEYEKFLQELEISGRVLSFRYGAQQLYALTAAGSHELSAKARRIRDKRRLYLLRAAHQRRFGMSRRVSSKELAGASPASDTRSIVKLSEANKDFGLAEEQGQSPCWPRILWQFNETGPTSAALRDTFPPFLSFSRRDEVAKSIRVPSENFQFDLSGLGATIGISPKLIAQIVENPSRHYRAFPIKKRGGGVREIESPRVFLKVIQWVLLEFVLKNLRISGAAHAFAKGRSIVSNASLHVGQRFVAGFDIKDFFGSVTTTQIESLLQSNGFRSEEARLIAALCTKDGRLPQGAPTSPILSNALLFDFDEWSIAEAKKNRFTYTRYADDVTISAGSHDELKAFITKAEEFLKARYLLHLNDKKTRIASYRGQQIVTGVVVNEKATPSRERLRKIRALFHQASKKPKSFASRANELTGIIGFLSQFPKFQRSRQLKDYGAVLAQVRRFLRSAPKRKRAASA